MGRPSAPWDECRGSTIEPPGPVGASKRASEVAALIAYSSSSTTRGAPPSNQVRCSASTLRVGGAPCSLEGALGVVEPVHRSAVGPQFVQVFTLREGKIVRIWSYPSFDEALEAVGINE